MKNLLNYILESNKESDIFYHGSMKKFDKFDLKYVNTGNKQQAFGFGIYVASAIEAAERYGNIIYKVRIPKIDKKYIEGNKLYSKNFVLKIFNKLYDRLINDFDDLYKGSERELLDELKSLSNEKYDGNTLYGTVTSYLGSDKDASIFFDKLGYYGIVYRDKKIINAVIFNTDNIEILNQV